MSLPSLKIPSSSKKGHICTTKLNTDFSYCQLVSSFELFNRKMDFCPSHFLLHKYFWFLAPYQWQAILIHFHERKCKRTVFTSRQPKQINPNHSLSFKVKKEIKANKFIQRKKKQLSKALFNYSKTLVTHHADLGFWPGDPWCLSIVNRLKLNRIRYIVWLSLQPYRRQRTTTTDFCRFTVLDYYSNGLWLCGVRLLFFLSFISFHISLFVCFYYWCSYYTIIVGSNFGWCRWVSIRVSLSIWTQCWTGISISRWLARFCIISRSNG